MLAVPHATLGRETLVIDDYSKKLISWMGHHARRYLNTYGVDLNEINENGAIILVDCKMRILSQTHKKPNPNSLTSVDSSLRLKNLKEQINEKPNLQYLLTLNPPKKPFKIDIRYLYMDWTLENMFHIEIVNRNHKFQPNRTI
ncbi:hypothetical protein Glove_334g31 [Diversispora epigaea]|uniref:Uncharacterized protein n=1 Tax=Diversispora epigaea TaxID=1348612 RepID=A0A397HLL0_9GLOM|nr:hypothetical protein Glove_334g31 [Diversispora epigaea]